jgi:cysteine-rich repeat protein
VSICGDQRRSVDEKCDDGNTYPGDGCDHECKIEAGAVCSANKVGAQSVCNKVVCGDGKIQTSDDGHVSEQCDDGRPMSEGDGCAPDCQIEPGFKCAVRGGKSECAKVVCGDGLQDTSHDQTLVEACDDGNAADGDGCSSACALEEGFICSARKEAKTSCLKPVCGDGYRESVPGLIEACDDGNAQDGDGCSAACSVEEGFTCSPAAGAPKRKDASGVGDWTSAGKDTCTGPPKEEKGAAAADVGSAGKEEKKEEKKESGGFFSNMFGGKKKDEV